MRPELIGDICWRCLVTIDSNDSDQCSVTYGRGEGGTGDLHPFCCQRLGKRSK